MKVAIMLAGFAAGILFAQHYHRLDWAAFTSASVQQCTKGSRG